MQTASTNQLNEIASLFAIEGNIENVTALGEGLINDTYLATSSSGNRYVLQRINRNVFRDVDTLQNNLHHITSHIRKCLEQSGEKEIERRVLTPIRTLSSGTWAEYRGEAWRMTRFIEGSATHTKVTPAMAELTGKAFARFHAYFARHDAPQLKESIPDFHNIVFRIEQLRQAADIDKAGRLNLCREEVDYLLSRAYEMLHANRLFEAGELPKRTAHCDTKLNNILFDNSGDILCVIDLDTTMPGFVMSDFGDFIRTAANTGLEDDKNPEHVSVDMEIFRHFAKGYVTQASFLTETERKLLPFGALMLTYMQSVRFLTDYLDDDSYYKTAYADHNLVRTRAQIALLKSIDAHYDEMQHFIDNIQ